MVIAGIARDPSLIDTGSFEEDFLGDFGFLANLSEEIGYIVLPGEEGEIPVHHDAIKAVLNPLQIGPKEHEEQLHWRSFLGWVLFNETLGWTPMHFKQRRSLPEVFEVGGTGDPDNSSRCQDALGRLFPKFQISLARFLASKCLRGDAANDHSGNVGFIAVGLRGNGYAAVPPLARIAEP